jgi:hypothetical protein
MDNKNPLFIWGETTASAEINQPTNHCGAETGEHNNDETKQGQAYNKADQYIHRAASIPFPNLVVQTKELHCLSLE